MPVSIPASGWLSGGSHLNEGHRLRANFPTIEEVVRSVVGDDVANLFTMVQAIATKLDADAGVSDTDYAATIDAIATGPETTVL